MAQATNAPLCAGGTCFAWLPDAAIVDVEPVAALVTSGVAAQQPMASSSPVQGAVLPVEAVIQVTSVEDTKPIDMKVGDAHQLQIAEDVALKIGS